MKVRREILITALRAAGLAVPASLAGAATPYVRTESQRGQLTDEINRFRAELHEISSAFEVYPAEKLMPAIVGIWANLDSLRDSRSHPRIQEFKSRTAFYAGTLSTTLGDVASGTKWFNLGHGLAILSGNRDLKSFGHSREAIAGIYWGRASNRVAADAHLACKNARSQQERGLAFMATARVIGDARQNKRAVLESIELALECAIPNSGVAPEPDGWWMHQAEMMAALALSGYGGMMGAIASYTADAMAGLPRNAVLLRTHAQLTLAEAYASDREYDECSTRALSALRAVPDGHRHPVLIGRAFHILKRMESVAGQPSAVVRLASGLRALQGEGA